MRLVVLLPLTQCASLGSHPGPGLSYEERTRQTVADMKADGALDMIQREGCTRRRSRGRGLRSFGFCLGEEVDGVEGRLRAVFSLGRTGAGPGGRGKAADADPTFARDPPLEPVRRYAGGADDIGQGRSMTSEPESTTPARSWHALAIDSVFDEVRSSADGLSAAEAKKRLSEHGPNVLRRVAGDGPLRILWRQINDPLIWVLIGSAGIAIAIGKVTDGSVVGTVVVLNSIIGFVQEYRATKAIEALRDMVPEFATTFRDGHRDSVSVADLVPGDVIELASGDKVPADVRLIAVKNLRAEEAALTGESVPVEKNVKPVEEEASLGDRSSMAFGGTLVTYGTARGVVVSTGARTELGRISEMLQEATELETPLTRALAGLGKVITIAIIVLSAIILAIGLWRALDAGVALGSALRETLIFAIALAVGAIPEGLPAIVTIALAIGVRRMAARRAIVRRLPAVETLGSTTVICSDKTGTLTRNEMTVQAVWIPDGDRCTVQGVGYEPQGAFEGCDAEGGVPKPIRRLLEHAALCNDASLVHDEGVWSIAGDPTEGALVVAAEKAGIDVRDLRKGSARRDAIPFESENQFMATLHEDDGQLRVLLKGAPEVVLQRCEQVDAERVREQVHEMASRGMRVLAVADKPSERDEIGEDDVAGGFSFAGLMGMIDPPREEAIAAVDACRRAGIQVKMITGDHRVTARAIGKELGLAERGDGLEGRELAHMDDDAMREAAAGTAVFARVAPEHKLQIVKALQAEGQVTAMTGDGVNDAPALKQSNIGVAMGITGSSVAKEAADIVLTDDNFATIVAAVEEGRRVYDNLVKSLAFVLPTNLGLALILMYAVLLLPFDPVSKDLLLPIEPTQLLWINMVAAVALALPLGFEAKEPNVMQRPPRDPNEPIMSKLVVRRTVIASVLMTIGAVGMFRWEYLMPDAAQRQSLAVAQTMAVTTVIVFQVFYLLTSRSLRDSVLRIGVMSNPYVYVGIGITLTLQAAFIYAPPLQSLFGTAPLSPYQLLLSAVAGSIVLPVIVVDKWWTRRGSTGGTRARAPAKG